MTAKARSALWIALGLAVLIALVVTFAPYVTLGGRSYAPPKTRFSVDQMIDICKRTAAQTRRAADIAAGERSYDDCMARLLRE